MARSLAYLVALGAIALPAPADGPVHPPDVYAQRPVLREVLADVVLWANFEGTPEPVWGRRYEQGSEALEGEFVTAPGLVGQAFVSESRSRCRYPAEGNLDLTRPGALSFWVCPVAWDRSQPTGIRNNLFGTNYSDQGYFGINRMAARAEGGRQVQDDMLYFYAESFPGANRTYIQLGDTLGPEWENGIWHLIVINWKGSHFEVSVDGGGLKSGDLGTPIDPAAVNDILVGGCQEQTLIDEFMIYGRPLTAGEIAVLCNALSGK